MKKYKFSVSKWQNKYTIVISGETQDEAREKVHNEWYSILRVEEFKEDEFQGEKFLFQIVDASTKEIKWGTIIGTDLFKVYLKLKKDLGYDIVSLFSEKDKNSTQTEKDRILSDLKEQLTLFEKSQTKTNIGEEVKVNLKNSQLNTEGFHLKKELEDTYRLIDFVLKKLENLINNSGDFTISVEKKEKLREVYTNIIKIKKSTNISKLKQVWEVALVKIGQIELENIEVYQKEDARSLLKETNSLLKQIGSKEVFIEESKDLGKLLQKNVKSFTDFFQKFKNIKEIFRSKKVEIDKTSYSYLKTVLLLKKYEQRLSQNTSEIISNFWVFLFPFGKNIEKKEYILLKRRVIKQNISLLKAKKSWKVYSYTFIKKGYSTVIGYFFHLLFTLKSYIFGIVYTYIFCFLISLNFYYLKVGFIPEINIVWILYFTFFILFFVTISLSKNIITLAINFVFFSFLLIFGVVNF